VSKPNLFIQDYALVCPLGHDKATIASALTKGVDGIRSQAAVIEGGLVPVGEVDFSGLPEQTDYLDLKSRNTRLLQGPVNEIAASVDKAKKRYGANRIAVIMGSSTSGIAAGESAFASMLATGAWPEGFCYEQQELGAVAQFVARALGLTGPAYTVATACSSSAKVFASARRTIAAGFADAAIVGGADSLCEMTVNGFNSLQLLSSSRCLPFSANRSGITLGEGASLFLLTSEPADIALLGVGESSDAYHMTSPDPEGQGAQRAMTAALNDAALAPENISYINLHGTASILNDQAEAAGITGLFGENSVPCSSTKGLTGHMLGAAGGCEAAFLCLQLDPAFDNGLLPVHAWDGVPDPNLPNLNLVTPGQSRLTGNYPAMLSNSFGFGGSNVALLLGRSL